MRETKNGLIEPLLKNGNIYKLKCEKCGSISIQISEQNVADDLCYECGGKSKII